MSGAARIRAGEYTLGGRAGSHPAALMGTIFFANQKLMRDPERGEFDRAAALKQIITAQESAASTGAAMFLDIVAESPLAMERQIEFVVASTDLPFLVDASDRDVRLAGLETTARLGVLPRTIYNSLSLDSDQTELAALEEHPPAAVVVSALDTADYGLDSAVRIAREMAGRLPAKMRKRILLDVGFLDEVSVRMAGEIAKDLRQELSMPVGGAACNGLQMWDNLKERGPEAQKMALAATLGFCAAFGLDFIFFGPLRLAPQAALAQSVVDIYNYYGLLIQGQAARPGEDHPLSLMFR
ncbi:MAG: hypothetical protein KKC37_12485 [Proteobacteria bacterium]|nr:hypothetical protein [Pseudomonadota bacterium]